MLTLTGRVARVESRQVTPANSAPFTETTYVVVTMGATYYVKRSRDFGVDLAEGQDVSLEVSVRAYTKKTGEAGYGFTALRLADAPAGKRLASAG